MCNENATTYEIIDIKAGVEPPVVPLRLEVDTWYSSTEKEHVIQVNLFILALHEFESMDSDEELSFFQVADRLQNFGKCFTRLSF